jgi:hypothetical protein
MYALIGRYFEGPVFGILVLVVMGIAVHLAWNVIRGGSVRRNQQRCRERLRREFWGNE